MGIFLYGNPNGTVAERIAHEASMHNHAALKPLIAGWTDADGDSDAKEIAIARAMHIAMERSRVGSTARGHKVSYRLGELNQLAIISTCDVLMEAGATLDFIGDLGLAPVHAAVLEKNPELLVHLLRKGASPDFLDHQGKTALRHCVDTGDRASARELLRAGADPNHQVDGLPPMTDSAIFGRYSGGVDWMLIAYGGKTSGKGVEASMLEAAARVRDTDRILELLDGMEQGASTAAVKLRSYVAQTMAQEQGAAEFLSFIDAISAKAVMVDAVKAAHPQVKTGITRLRQLF